MNDRKTIEDDLALLLDKPILTNWEVGQALRIVAGLVIDVQEKLDKPIESETNATTENQNG